MRGTIIVAAVLVTAFAVTRPAAAATCAPRAATSAYEGSVRAATNSGRDVWGDELLAARNGPTFAAANRFLAPLLYATQRGRRPLTSSGVYYLAFSYPRYEDSGIAYGLHVADGSEIITRRVGGPHLTILVGGERYGSCLERLQPAKRAEGWLPILQTGYTDAGGVRYHQESFVGHVANARSIVSFVQLTVDTTRAKRPAVIRFRASRSGHSSQGDRLVTSGGTRLIVSAGGRFTGRGFAFTIPVGQTATFYAEWFHRASNVPRAHADAAQYVVARTAIQQYWEKRLAAGATFSVPEEHVMDAERALLVQQLTHGWHYSLGNPYEELSMAEAIDTAEVMAGYGFDDDARLILRAALERLNRPLRLNAWRAGERLLGGAVYWQLFHDREFLDREAHGLATVLAKLKARQQPNGRFRTERLSSDVPDLVDSVPAQVVAWQGLLAMSRAWSVTGHKRLAAKARDVALRLEPALRRAVRRALVRLPGGSVFVPAALSAKGKPWSRITATRDGSYWNLVMPYVFASGFFPAGGRDARGLMTYLDTHGSRLLGVARADAHITYGYYVVGDGLGPAYQLGLSRFLADNDRPDQLVLSLYGMLAVGMTANTFVSGEAVSVIPVEGRFYRSMYMPPNLGANSSYLETLRLMLVHERRGRRGAPTGLDLAFGTPRSWLRNGQTIEVDRAPTSFGRLSFTIARTGSVVRIHVEPPARATSVRLRLRLPFGERIASVRGAEFDANGATIDLSSLRRATDLVAVIR